MADIAEMNRKVLENNAQTVRESAEKVEAYRQQKAEARAAAELPTEEAVPGEEDAFEDES